MGEQFLESQDSSVDREIPKDSGLDESAIFASIFGPEDTASKPEPTSLESSAMKALGGLALDNIDADTFAKASSVSVSDDSTDSYSQKSSAAKILDIAGASVANAPGMYVSELTNDIENNPLGVAATFGMGTGIGFGATGILKRMPKTGKTMLVGAALYSGYHYGSKALDFFSDATEAKSWNDRNNLVDRGSLGLAREGVLLTEAAPGMLLGGSLGVRAFGKPQLYQSVQDGVRATKAYISDTKVAHAVKSTPPGQALARYSAFRGSGSMELPMSVKVPGPVADPTTRINYMMIDDLLGGPKANQFSMFEEARAIDVAKLRVSKKIVGSAKRPEVDMGFTGKAHDITVHTHKPGNLFPSLKDAQANYNTSIIYSGDDMIVFEGQRAQFEAIAAQSLKLGKPVSASEISVPIRGARINPADGTATLFESVAGGTIPNRPMFTTSEVSLDQAAQVLGNGYLRNIWTQLKPLRPTAGTP